MFFILPQKKICSKCGASKSLAEFYEDKSLKSGRMAKCKVCTNKASREWAKNHPEKTKTIYNKWRLGNLDYERERKRRLRSANPEKHREENRMWLADNREKARELKRRHYAENIEIEREKHRKQQRVLYATGKEKVIARIKRWLERNPGKRLEFYRNRRARIKGNGGTITDKEWLALLEKYGYKCLCCGRNDVKLTLDHVVPLDKGGPNTIDNAQPLCGSCNSSKGTKIIDYRP